MELDLCMFPYNQDWSITFNLTHHLSCFLQIDYPSVLFIQIFLIFLSSCNEINILHQHLASEDFALTGGHDLYNFKSCLMYLLSICLWTAGFICTFCCSFDNFFFGVERPSSRCDAVCSLFRFSPALNRVQPCETPLWLVTPWTFVNILQWLRDTFSLFSMLPTAATLWAWFMPTLFSHKKLNKGNMIWKELSLFQK